MCAYSIGISSSNYYRWYVPNGNLGASARINGTRTQVVPEAPYNAATERYWRIRHIRHDDDTNTVSFETSAGGSDGSWVVRHEERWATTALPLGSIKFELKAGTETVNASPGTVRWDNFRATRP